MSMKSATPDRCRLPSALWKALEREGLSVPDVLRRARLPAMLRLQPSATLATAQYFALWRAVEDLSGDPGLGLRLASNAETGAHPPSSLAAFYARDYRDGLLRLAGSSVFARPRRFRSTKTRRRRPSAISGRTRQKPNRTSPRTSPSPP